MTPASTDLEPSDVRAGYQFVGQMLSYEGQLVWRHARAFILVLAALLVGAFLERFPGVSGQATTAAMQVISAALGLVSALVWWSMASRSRGYYSYWIAQGRELESHMPGIDILTKGRKFGDGESVEAGGQKLRLRAFASYSHGYQVNYLYALVTCVCTLVLLSRTWYLIRIL